MKPIFFFWPLFFGVLEHYLQRPRALIGMLVCMVAIVAAFVSAFRGRIFITWSSFSAAQLYNLTDATLVSQSTLCQESQARPRRRSS